MNQIIINSASNGYVIHHFTGPGAGTERMIVALTPKEVLRQIATLLGIEDVAAALAGIEEVLACEGE